MNTFRLLFLGAALAFGAPANAQVGFTVAGRISAAIPYGDAFQTSTGTPYALGTGTTASIPFQLDAGVTLAKRYFVGAYGQYRIGLAKGGACAEGVNCSDTGVRAGVEFLYQLAPRTAGISGWIGIGTGWEWSRSQGYLTGTDATLTLNGWEIAQLQVGVDLWMSKVLRLGFYLSASLGQFSQASLSDGSDAVSTSIASKTLHGWFEMGMKSTFDF